MVISRLSGKVSYPEMSRLEASDFQHVSGAYELDLLGKTVIIALGQADFSFRKYGVVFYPIYLIHTITHDVMCKLGVVEYRTGDVSHLSDTGEVKLDAQPFAPLLFASVNATVLQHSLSEIIASAVAVTAASAPQNGKPRASSKKNRADTPAAIDKAASNTDEIVSAEAPIIANLEKRGLVYAAAADYELETDEGEGEEDEGEDQELKDVPLPTQTKELASVEKKQYETAHAAATMGGMGGGGMGGKSKSGIKRPAESWIQRFMHNKYFAVEDNEGGNDSIFATVRDGLRSQGRVITIDEMRTALSEMATKELYDDYVRHFNKYAQSLKRTLNEVAVHDTSLAAITERKTQSQGQRLPVAELLKIEAELKRVTNRRESVKQTAKHLQDTIRTRYGYMKDTKGEFDKFKTVLKTRSFIPDAWMLRALERMYNVKLIRLSSPRFEAGDLDNVIMCGDEISDSPGLDLADFRAVHKPIFFIMTGVDEHGNYSLIKYRAKGSFSFAELPYDVRIQIITKCMESGGGEYEHIPQFKRMMESSPGYISRQRQTGGRTGDDRGKNGIIIDDEPGSESGTTHARTHSKKSREIPVLQFYNRASNEFPGKGSGEYVPASDDHLFIPLASIPNWRRALSNFAESPFRLDGHTWFSVEHYYQGSKFKKQNRDFYLQFSLDSGSEIAKDPALAKAAGSKSGMFKGRLYRPSAVKMDSDFLSNGQGPKSVLDAMDAKFRQNVEMKRILLATLNARLYHFQRGEKPVLFSNLMQIREKLR